MFAFQFSGTDVAAFRRTMEKPVRIHAVDNEPSVILSLRYVFAGPRYDVACADDGDSALATLDANPDPYDVIIVDQKVPHLSVTQLVEGIRNGGITSKLIV